MFLSSRTGLAGGHRQSLTGGRPYPLHVSCYVEPSPAGGYFVRLRGEAAPLSRHDTEEEAEAAAAAYDRGLARQDSGEYVLLKGGGEVLVSSTTHDLVEGSGLLLEDAGTHVLKGLSGPRMLFRLSVAR